MARVAELMEAWARERDGSPEEILRWRATAFLHDALRDAPPAELRQELGREAEGLPDSVLHGPAVAARLRREGVEDPELLRAVASHTTGHADLGEMGMALYCADFLEPGRSIEPEWRASLRDRMPRELAAVTREILEAHLHHLLDRGLPILPDTAAFWNRLVGWSARGPDRAAGDGPPGPAGALRAGA